MEFDKAKMEKALEAFMKNPHHKKVYEEAPSDECRDYYKAEYYYSKYYDPDAKDADEFIEMVKAPEEKLSIKDWQYLKEHVGNSPIIGYYNQKIKELSGK